MAGPATTSDLWSRLIDRHYGHLARDGREHAIQLLDALNTPELNATIAPSVARTATRAARWRQATGVSVANAVLVVERSAAKTDEFPRGESS